MFKGLALAAALALGACGWNSRPAQMVAPGDAAPALAGAIAVGDVTGGRELWALYITETSDRAVAGALERSLASRGMLAANDPRFRFEAKLADWVQPTHGDDMTVAVTLRCRLSTPGDARAYWEAEEAVRHTAPLAAANAAGDRLRLASEGAVRAGLQACLDGLATQAVAEPARFAPGAPPPEPPAPQASNAG